LSGSKAAAPGTWLAAICAREGLPFVLGPARALQASHGGKAHNDTIAAQQMAGGRRGGLLPQAYVYPADRRATRDLRRRRRHRMRTRAARRVQSPQTTRQ